MSAVKKVADKMLGASWKTSIAGWLTIVGAVASALGALLDGNPDTMPDWNEVLVAAAGVGLLVSRDNKVTSEQANSNGN